MISDKYADTIWTGGKVETIEPGLPWVEAFAVSDGKFMAVGNDNDICNLVGPGTKCQNLHGRYVMPGLVESHTHALKGGCRDLLDVFVGYRATCKELLDALKERAASLPVGCVIRGGPWRLDMRSDMGPCPRQLLDGVAPNHIVVLYDVSHHCTWSNTRTLESAGILQESPEVPGGVIERDGSGVPTGILAEMACAPLRELAEYSGAELAKAAEYFIGYFNQLGYTAFKEPMAFEADLKAYREADRRGALSLHSAAHIVRSSPNNQRPVDYEEMECLRREYASENLKTSFAKVFLDGVPAAFTASFIDPYLDSAGYDSASHEPDSTLLIPVDELNETVRELDRRGFVTKMHAVGDNAVRAGLNAIEFTRQRNGNNELRHEIAHCSYVHPNDIQRFKALNAVAEQSPMNWFPCVPTQTQNTLLGKERVDRCHPIRDLLESGANVTFATDWPVAAPDANPWKGLAGMISRQDPTGTIPGAVGSDQALSLQQALPIFTHNGAMSLGMGDKTGTIRAGKWADFIVLEHPFHQMNLEEIGAIEVAQTFWKGNTVWSKS